MTKEQQALYIDNKKLIWHVLSEIKAPREDKEELFSVCKVGLVRAAISYDPEKGKAFSTFAVTCIKNELFGHLGRDQKRSVTPLFSTDAPIGHVDVSGNCSPRSELVTVDEDAYEDYARVDGAMLLEQLLPQLSDDERKLLTMRFGLGGAMPQSYEEIGKVCGLTAKRIGYEVRRAIKRLRKHALTL